MGKDLDKTYDPHSFEDRLYAFWQEKGYFSPVVDHDKKPYSIMMPPPNITGQLHLGHALDNTLQDILIRFKRMQGYCTLWLPGTDHASIATEAKVVEAMAKEGLTKEGVGREEFLRRTWQWKETYGSRINAQIKRLGSSCDWSRECFTMDEGCSRAVREVFVNLYEKGLIYQGERIINWCPHCKTSISDAEVEFEEQAGHFWHIKYPLTDGSGYLEVATTRPETMLGDTGIAVNPNDERYKHLIGKTAILPLVGRELPIVGDEYVEMDFGTGVVKMTPAHDPNDFEVGLRHNLEVINVMNEDATINEKGGKYAGLDRYEARKQIVADLEEQGYLIKIEDYSHNVGSCYRCGTTIEPMISKQWFVKMKPLAEPAIEAVRSGKTNFVPERFDKIYYNWMENIRDWCISRQLWWGHRIPAWYCEDCGEVIVSKEDPTVCPKCGSTHLHQDEDTLDTWFSSALWPFSTLGWPDKTEDLEYFYPTSTLVTGYDIIFFWVARMIFSGIEHMGETPFENVFIHGIVRDAQGRKMSKSLGNGVDPLEIIDRYGADSLRFTLVNGISPGSDMRFSEEKVTSSRNFANKLWNAARFILMNLPDADSLELSLPSELTAEDKWVLTKYDRLVQETTDALERFDVGVAAGKIYDFIWDIYCDWYIELAKSRLQAGGETADNARRVLVYVMTGVLQMLHPFMPFITEEIWQALPHEGESIMVSKWPESNPALRFDAEEADFEKVMNLIRAVRNVRAEMNVPPSRKAKLFIETKAPEIFRAGQAFIERLAFAPEVEIGESFDLPGAAQAITADARILIPMDELIDREKELARLEKEKAACQKDIDFLSGKLSNAGFVAKAPEKVIAMEREKLAKAEEKLARIEESIRNLG